MIQAGCFHHHKIIQSAWFELSGKRNPRELEKDLKQTSNTFIKVLIQKQAKWFQNKPNIYMTNEYSIAYAMTQGKLQKVYKVLLSRHKL